MRSNPLIYSLKVWLTSVGIAPLVFFIIGTSSGNHSQLSLAYVIDQAIQMYLMYVVFGGIFSIITWLLFYLIVKGITMYFQAMPQVKLSIALLGSLLSVGTFAVFFPLVGLGYDFYYLVASYSICIAAGSLYYNLRIVDEEEIVIIQ